eukprot:TRINITY_DN614_c0_g2_i1.p1 TRINITY_DN614_c0_g2~~TRINITY_DN614_c0_g2_i1.p1  ORF type:complete len:1040 (+),score=209.94 TRINITY_DN614_c0_g2_i1:92-3211(+)
MRRLPLPPWILAAAALVSVPSAAVGPRTFKIAMMLSGPPEDLTWNFRHNRGRLQMVDHMLNMYPDLSLQSEFRVLTDRLSNQTEHVEEVVERYGRDKWDLVIACSLGFQRAVISAAARYPSTSWVSIADFAAGPPNFATAYIRVYQARYVGGIAAASQTKTKKIGMVAAHPHPQVTRGLNAFALGVRSVDTSMWVYVNWVYSWHDKPRDALAAQWLLELGCDTLHAHTNDRDVYSVFMDKGYSAVGYHTDLRDLYSDLMVTSAYFTWHPLYISYADAIMNNRSIPVDSFVGMEVGAASVGKPSQYVPLWARQRMAEAEARLRQGADTHPVHRGSGMIFCGPLRDEYGYLVLKTPADCVTLDGLREMTWLVEGIEDLGPVPMPDEVCAEGFAYRWLPQGRWITDNSQHFLGPSAPGKRKLRWSFICTPCSPGFFSPLAGSTSCAPCAPGHYSPGSSDTHNATVCIPCPEGQFTDRNSSQGCELCPEGWYNGGEGNTGCPIEVLTQSWIARNWWVLVLAFGGAAIVIAPPLVFIFTSQSRRMRALYNNSRVAEECAESIAAMRLEEVRWIEDIPNPNRIQRAFIKIIVALKEYRSFLPPALFAMRNGHTDADTDVETISEDQCSPGLDDLRERRETNKTQNSGGPSGAAGPTSGHSHSKRIATSVTKFFPQETQSTDSGGPDRTAADGLPRQHSGHFSQARPSSPWAMSAIDSGASVGVSEASTASPMRPTTPPRFHMQRRNPATATGVWTKHLSVMYLNVADFHQLWYTAGGKVAAETIADVSVKVLDTAHQARGLLHQQLGDRFLFTFDGAQECTGHCMKSAEAGMRCEAVLRPIARAHVGVAMGKATLGVMGADNARVLTVIGPVINRAYACCRAAKVHGAGMVTMREHFEDTKEQIAYRCIGIWTGLKLGGVCPLFEALGAMENASQDEWMYVLAAQEAAHPYTAFNQLVLQHCKSLRRHGQTERVVQDASSPGLDIGQGMKAPEELMAEAMGALRTPSSGSLTASASFDVREETAQTLAAMVRDAPMTQLPVDLAV